ALAHTAEGMMGQFRDGLPVTTEAVTLVLSTIDRIKSILDAIEMSEGEPAGDDLDLIGELNRFTASQRTTPPAPRIDVTPSRSAASADDETASVPPAQAKLSGEKSPAERPASERLEGERADRLANHSIRVHVETLRHLMNTVSELVLTRNQLLEIVRRHEDSDFNVPLQRLSNVTAELQEGVMKTRMQPIGNGWQKLPRIVRDLSADLGKDIELKMRGAETELDRQVLELVRDPLTHLVRNCADHGIETPVERLAAGKPEQGTIRLSACHQGGGHITIEIA